jgi:hypothetical protein
MWVRSCGATLAGGGGVVGDQLSEATCFRSGGQGKARRRSRMVQVVTIKYDDGTPGPTTSRSIVHLKWTKRLVWQKTCNN